MLQNLSYGIELQHLLVYSGRIILLFRVICRKDGMGYMLMFVMSFGSCSDNNLVWRGKGNVKVMLKLFPRV